MQRREALREFRPDAPISLPGYLPESFLKDMEPFPIQTDYNRSFSTILVMNAHPLLFPEQYTYAPGYVEGVPEIMRETLRNIPTYSEYIASHVEKYNIHAQEQGLPIINPHKALKTLVIDVPKTETLDALAKEIRATAEEEITESLLLSIVHKALEICVITKGDGEEANKIRQSFKLEQEA